MRTFHRIIAPEPVKCPVIGVGRGYTDKRTPIRTLSEVRTILRARGVTLSNLRIGQLERRALRKMRAAFYEMGLA